MISMQEFQQEIQNTRIQRMKDRMFKQRSKWKQTFIIILIISLIQVSFATLQYPVTVGSFTNDFTLQGFTLDVTGNLAVAAMTADLALVTTANENLVLYYPITANNWLWAKTLGSTTANDVLSDIKVTGNRIALIYESSLFVLISTVDGSVVTSQRHSDLQCNLGCFMLYNSPTLLQLLGVFNIGGQEKLGISIFNPNSGIASSSIYTYSNGAYQFRYPFAELTPDNRIFMGFQSAAESLLMIAPSTLTSFSTLYRLPSNTRVRGMGYQDSGSGKRFVIYLEDLAQPHRFIMQRSYIDTNDPTNPHQFIFTATSTANTITYLGLQIIDIYNYYLFVYLSDERKFYLFTVQQNFVGYSYSSQVINQGGTTNVPLKVFNGCCLRGGTQMYTGGNNAFDFYSNPTIGASGALNKVGFVYSFQQSESSMTVQGLSPGAYTDVGGVPPSVSVFVATGTSFSTTNVPYISQPISSVDLGTIGMQPASYIPSCLTDQTVAASYPILQNYFLEDTLIVTLTPVMTPLCSGVGVACSHRARLDPLLTGADVTFTYNEGLSQISFQTSNVARDEQIIMVEMISIDPAVYLNPCGDVYNHLKFRVMKPYIVTTGIPQVVYNLYDPQLNQILPGFTNSKGITGEPKLDIQYEIKMADGSTTLPAMVVGFVSATRTLSLATADDTLPRLYSMKVVAYFAYLPSYKVEVPFTMILEKCFQTVINKPSMSTMFYQVGEAARVQVLSGWTNKYSTECEPFTFTALFSPTSAIQFDSLVPKFTVFSSLPSADGLYPTTLTGTLTQPWSGTLYKQLSGTFNIIIIHPSISYIIPQDLDSVTYILRDPVLKVTLPVFPTSKPTYLTANYDLLQKDGSQYKTALFQFQDRELSTLSENIQHIGVHQMMVKAYFSKDTSYFVMSKVFTVQVLHWCVRNVITAPEINVQEYRIGAPQLSFKVNPWDLSMKKDCEESLQYSATLSDGASLPKFIKFDAKALKFQVFTPLAKEAKIYQVKVRGVTKYFDMINSQIVRQFAIQVLCVPQKIYSQYTEPLKYTIMQGSPFPTIIKLKDFVLFPSCKGPGTEVNLEAGLSTGGKLPPYAILKADDKTLTLQDDGTMKAGPIQFLVSGNNAGIRASVLINLNIVPYSLTLSDQVILDPVSLIVKADQKAPFLYIPTDFSTAFTIFSDDPQLLSFAKISSNQELSLSPKERDLGKYSLYLITDPLAKESNDEISVQKKESQIVNIKVVPSNGKGGYQEVTAIIQQISKNGLVKIDFNLELKNIQNSSLINETVLQLAITEKDGTFNDKINYTWRTEGFHPKKIPGEIYDKGYEGSRLLIRLNFTEPLKVSLYVSHSIIQQSYIGLLISQGESTQSLIFQVSRIRNCNCKSLQINQENTQAAEKRWQALLHFISIGPSQNLDYLTTQLQIFIQLVQQSSGASQFFLYYYFSSNLSILVHSL